MILAIVIGLIAGIFVAMIFTSGRAVGGITASKGPTIETRSGKGHF